MQGSANLVEPGTVCVSALHLIKEKDAAAGAAAARQNYNGQN